MSFQSFKPGAENLLLFTGQAQVAVAPFTAKPLLPVLIVLHQETSSPGRVGNVLRTLGHPLDIRRPRFGDALPETLDGHAGAVIFGGPMSANDPDDFVRQEIDWISVPLKIGRAHV
jgi:GMP synthase (glutamine-hydrolysing)